MLERNPCPSPFGRGSIDVTRSAAIAPAERNTSSIQAGVISAIVGGVAVLIVGPLYYQRCRLKST
jgi:hypothetical protein